MLELDRVEHHADRALDLQRRFFVVVAFTVEASAACHNRPHMIVVFSRGTLELPLHPVARAVASGESELNHGSIPSEVEPRLGWRKGKGGGHIVGGVNGGEVILVVRLRAWRLWAPCLANLG